MSFEADSQDPSYESQEGTAAASPPVAAAMDKNGQDSSFGTIPAATSTEEPSLPEESRTNDSNTNTNTNTNGDSSNPPSGEIAVVKLSNEEDEEDDNDEDDNDNEDVTRAVAEAMENDASSDSVEGTEEQNSSLGEEPSAKDDEDDMFARSAATGDESDSNSNSNPLNEDDEVDTDAVCQPVTTHNTVDAAEFATADDAVAVLSRHAAAAAADCSARDAFAAAAPRKDRAPGTHRRTNSDTNRKKRLCRFPGCTRVIKSQGHCQRHGAKAKRCKVRVCVPYYALLFICPTCFTLRLRFVWQNSFALIRIQDPISRLFPPLFADFLSVFVFVFVFVFCVLCFYRWRDARNRHRGPTTACASATGGPSTFPTRLLQRPRPHARKNWRNSHRRPMGKVSTTMFCRLRLPTVRPLPPTSSRWKKPTRIRLRI